jgi:hypothetical protein
MGILAQVGGRPCPEGLVGAELSHRPRLGDFNDRALLGPFQHEIL